MAPIVVIRIHRASPPRTRACTRLKVAMVFLSTTCRALDTAVPERMNMMRAVTNVRRPPVPLDRRARTREAAPP